VVSLFSNLTATGNSYSTPVDFVGDATLVVSGGFGGGTLQLQIKSPTGVYVPVDGSDIAAEVAKNISLSPVTLRAALLNAATAPSLTAVLMN
jgi:hypothetical protein